MVNRTYFVSMAKRNYPQLRMVMLSLREYVVMLINTVCQSYFKNGTVMLIEYFVILTVYLSCFSSILIF